MLAARPVAGVAAAYVFGSMAERREHRDSDVDLGVLFDRHVHLDERSRFDAQVELRRHLSPASVGREVDIVVLNDVSPISVAGSFAATGCSARTARSTTRSVATSSCEPPISSPFSRRCADASTRV